MKQGINRVTLMGNVGDDPKVFEKNGELVNTTFSFATNEVYKDKNGDEQKKTEWHRVKVWNKQAGVVKDYVKKGDPLYLEGKLHYDSWDDPKGEKKYFTEVVVDSLVFLKSKPSEVTSQA